MTLKHTSKIEDLSESKRNANGNAQMASLTCQMGKKPGLRNVLLARHPSRRLAEWHCSSGEDK